MVVFIRSGCGPAIALLRPCKFKNQGVVMKQYVLALSILVGFIQPAFAGPGDACAATYRKLGVGGDWSTEALVNYCNEKGYTAAHAEGVELFIQTGVDTSKWGANELFAW